MDSLHAQREEPEFWICPAEIPNAPVAVTVVVPTYNGASTLQRALDSVLRQTLSDIEIIVADDASTDATWPITAAAIESDRRVRAIRHKQNAGKAVGMNRAAASARGRWLAVLDADDWYHPERLTKLIALGEAQRVDMVADNQFFYDTVADVMIGSAWKPARTGWRLNFDNFLAGSDAYDSFNFGMLKPVVRADFIRRMSLLYDARARHGQDFLYLLKFFVAGGTAAITDEPLYYYTQPFGALSRQWSHSARRRYDFKAAYENNLRYLEAMHDCLTPDQAAQLYRRATRLKSLEYYDCAKERLLAGAPLETLLLASRRPSIVAYALRRASQRLVSRTGKINAIERVAAQARADMR
jgi:succinoglycan biosynthesis protein ExoO